MMFDADSPIKSYKEDELNREPFVKRLSQSISSYESPNCLVLGLMGEWGCGKTSILNLTFNEIKKEKEDWIFVEFDPWYFSNQDNLILQFFNSLFNELNFSKQIGRKAKNTIKKFFKGISLSINFKPISASINFDKIISNEEYKKFTSFKKDLEDIFLNLNSKIIISIDNIDRLTDAEISQIFALVHTLANFPNVIYILSFDNKLIINALQKLEVHSPEDFLKKIIQIPITVPQITESNLDLLIHKYIEPIYNIYFQDENRFLDNGFWELLQYLKPFLNNIRDLKRYLNILNFYCGHFIEDINIIDFMLILAIQTFQNSAYQEIKNNKELLTIIYDDQPNFTEIMQKLFENIKNRFQNFNENNINSLLIYLFPIFQELYGPDISINRIKLNNYFRICETEHFDKYFTLSLEESEVSDFYIDSIISYNVENLSKEFISLRDNNKLDSFLDKLVYKIKDLELESTEMFIEAFLKVSDEFFNEMILYNTKVNIILMELFNNIPTEEECFKILENALNQQDNLFTTIEFIYGIGFDYGYYKTENTKINTINFVTEIQFKTLEKKCREKINDLKNNRKLAENNYLSIFLKYWEDMGDKNEVNQYVKDITEKNSDLIKFLYKFRRIYKYHEYNSNEYDFDFGKIKKYFDMDELTKRIKTFIDSDTITKDEKEFCEYFLLKYNEKLYN